MKTYLFVLLSLAYAVTANAQTIVRVDTDSVCTNPCDLDGGDCDGSTWAKACSRPGAPRAGPFM
ncbi:MAG: hypothetical protein ACE5E6_04880 [Phycisphaerae bacterium]